MSDECIFCHHDPYYYDDISFGFEAPTVICCALGVALYQHGDKELARVADRIKELEETLRLRTTERNQADDVVDIYVNQVKALEAKLSAASYNATAFGHRIVALETKLERISEEWASALYGDLDHGVKSLSEAAQLNFYKHYPSIASFSSTLLDIMLEDNT